MTKKQLNKLKKNLPKNYRNTLAEKFNCTTRYINMVISGERENLEIVKQATQMAVQKRAEVEEVLTTIKSL